MPRIDSGKTVSAPNCAINCIVPKFLRESVRYDGPDQMTLVRAN
jgi:hypothetical protein